MAGYATPIDVTISDDGIVTVEDDGRGVPVGKHSTGKDALEVVHTVLHAGGKFGGGGYKVSGGLHGVGVSVVNALSEWLRVESARDGSVWAQEYARGKPTTPVTKIGPAGGPARHDDHVPRRSRDVRDDRLLVRRHLASACASRPTSTRASGSSSSTSAADRERSFYFEGGLMSFVRHLNRNKEALHPAPDLRRAARGQHLGRGRPPVQRHLHGERPRLRQQHQHRRRRHPRHRLPGGPDELAQRLGAASPACSRTPSQPLAATTSAKA